MELVFVLLASITFLQRAVAYFQLNPSNLAPIDEGDTMALNCIVSPEYLYVEWWKEGVKLSRNSQQYYPDVYNVTYSPKGAFHRYRLLVKSVTKESSDGKFKCKAFRAGVSSRSKTKTIHITVRYKPQSKYPLCEFNTTGKFAACVSEKGNPLYELEWKRRTFASRASDAIDSDYYDEDKYINKRIVQLTNFPTPSRDDDALICVFINEENRNCTLKYEEIYHTLHPPSISPNMTVPVGQNAIVNCTTTPSSIDVTINFRYSTFPGQVLLDKVQSENSLQLIRLPRGITRVDVSCHLRWGPFETIRSNVSSIRVLDDRTSIPTHLAKIILTQQNNSPLATQPGLITTMLQDVPADLTTDPSFLKLFETASSKTENTPFSTVTTDILHPTGFPTTPPPNRPHAANTPTHNAQRNPRTDLSLTEYDEMVSQSSESYNAILPSEISMGNQPKGDADLRDNTGTYQSSFVTTMPTKSAVTDLRYETSPKLLFAASSLKTVSSPPSIKTSRISQLPTSPTTTLLSKQSMNTSASDPQISPTNEYFHDEHHSTLDISSKSVSSTDKAETLSTEVKTILGLTTEIATYMGSEMDPTSFADGDWASQVTLGHKTLSLAEQSKTPSESSGTSLFVSKDDSQTEISPVLTSTQDDLQVTESVRTELTSEIANIIKTAFSPTSATQPIVESKGTDSTLLSASRTTELVSTYHSGIVGDTEITTPLKSDTAPSSSKEPTSQSQQSVITTMQSSTMFPQKTSLKSSKTTFKQSTLTTTAFNFPVTLTSQPSFINSTTITSKTRQVDTLPKETTTSSIDNTSVSEHTDASYAPSSPPYKLTMELWLLILLITVGIVIFVVVAWYIVWFVVRRKCTQYGQYRVVTKPIWVNSSPGAIGLHEIHL